MNEERRPFGGIVVALNACYDASGAVSPERTAKLARWYLSVGVKSLYVCGSTGEGLLMNAQERMRTVEAVQDAVGGEMDIMVHVGCASTGESVRLAKHAAACKVQALSAVPCVFYQPGEAAIERHWSEIAQAGGLPFFIYNIPQLTGYALSIPLLRRMLRDRRTAGVKSSANNAAQILEYKMAGGERFTVLTGADDEYLAGRAMGADGGIGGTYGTMPRLFLALEAFFAAGDWAKAQALQAVITRLIRGLQAFPSRLGASKASLALRGLETGQPRMPFLPVNPADEALQALHREILREEAVLGPG